MFATAEAWHLTPEAAPASDWLSPGSLVELYNGRLWLESGIGQGSSFTSACLSAALLQK
jgi:hypothetical protein